MARDQPDRLGKARKGAFERQVKCRTCPDEALSHGMEGGMTSNHKAPNVKTDMCGRIVPVVPRQRIVRGVEHGFATLKSL